MTETTEEHSCPAIAPTPTEAELDELESSTKDFIYDEILNGGCLSSGIATVRYVSKSRDWKRFVEDGARTYGDAGKEVILETLHPFCERLSRERRAENARERRAKQKADREGNRRLAQQPQSYWDSVLLRLLGQL